MKVWTWLLVLSFLAGCNPYKRFYTSWIDTKTLVDVEVLARGQQPQVIDSSDIRKDILKFRSKRYLVVGYSSFNGSLGGKQQVAAQAKRVGATLVLVSSKYENTRSSIKSTYGKNPIIYTSHQRRYNQMAVYLIRSTRKFKFGISYEDLSQAIRTEIERNMGVLIDVVIENSPAFHANVIAGDVLIAIDGKQVTNSDHARSLFDAIEDEQITSVLTVVRKRKIKELTVKFR